MKSGASRAKRWISLGLLMVMALSFALPAFALPNTWYKKIYVSKNPDRMTYEVGETFDPSGMEISGDVYDANGKYKQTLTLGLSTLTISPASFSKTGKQKVTLGLHVVGKSGNYEWLYTSVSVTVNESGDAPSEYYTDIFVAAQPNKTIYSVGESFKTSGLSISGHVYRLEDGKKHTVPKLNLKGMKISPEKFTKSGKQNVKLSLYLLAKNGEHKWFSTTVQVLVEKGGVKITKHPTGETVQEGGSCSFIARADNDDSRHWYFSKNGVVVDASDASSQFPGLKVSGTGKEQLKLSNIPVSLNGWSAYCVFYGNDGSVNSNKAGIVVLGKDPAPAPVTEAPKADTPQSTQAPVITEAPVITQAPVTAPPATPVPQTPKPTDTPKPTPEPEYAEGLHCTLNGQQRVLLQGDTILNCVAEQIDGFVFDHWAIDGEPDFSYGPSATFVVSNACVIRACYRERKVLRTVNCTFQFLTKKKNATGAAYTEFDFEDAYYDPVTKEYRADGTMDCYVTAVIPRKGQVDYWLINGVKYQFYENNIYKFRILDLNEATTIEVVFKGMSPSSGKSHSPRYAELVHQPPHVMRCINCWGQFPNDKGKPAGQEYLEFDFENVYTNPNTKKKLPGGLLDMYLATKCPRNCTVESWIINDVKYQFPQPVMRFLVNGLDEATTYEVRYKGVAVSEPDPTPATKYPYPGRSGTGWG